MLAELGTLVRRSPWKKSKCAMFGKFGDYYQDVMISVHRNSGRTIATLRCKPMALDPLLWDILDMSENQGQPLSFRTWGAFVCSGLPLLEKELEEPGQTPKEVATNALEFGVANRNLLEERLTATQYSELLERHPNQTARGAYAVTLVASLIHEGNEQEARRLASAYASGSLKSCSEFTSDGLSFHEHALRWLDAGRHSKSALLAASRA
jgi:hypothetical protein